MARKNSINVYKKALDQLTSPEKQKPVYYFCGEENFFLARLQEAAENLMPPEHEDFNLDIIYARDKSPEQVLGIARSFPMMAEQRIVIVRDFLSLNISSYNQTGKGGGLDAFLPYFSQPNPSTLLVLFDEKKPSGRTKLGKAITKNEQVGFFKFEEVKDYLLPDWVIEWTSTHHQKTMEPEAARMLAQSVGNNLQVLSSEIDKVCTFVDTSERITSADVKKTAGSYRQYSVFELKDALFEKDYDQSLFIAERMLQHASTEKGEIIRSVGFFYNIFSNIWRIRRLASKGKSKKQIQNTLGISNTWYFNKLWDDASAFSLSDMPRIFEALLDADSAAKGFSQVDAATILLLMIKRIIN
ncbi:MAG TPA: DNA polymerase III subunit delta [Balneolaceae bacterium]|nr:DNA polymerase III subunit delta [Balneolaceae bacterium]